MTISLATSAATSASKRLWDVWFKGYVPGQPYKPETFMFWWRSSPELDNQLRSEFKDDAERALIDQEFRESMSSTGEGAVALTLLLDQIPRNIFRGTPRPFVEFDPVARQVPLMHSENMQDQEQCVSLYTQDLETVEPMYKDMVMDSIKFAKAHGAVIEKFGRFPHRNEVLERATTEAEKTYLDNGGDRW
ncbi:hypothetical protein FBU30_004040 [Linnemannia zychae]|nr:hypothetical protein FBU30_004040 [Linnemannia zychae]